MIKNFLKTLDAIVFFLPRLIISFSFWLIKALDKRDVILILGIISIFYGVYCVSPPIAFIVLGLIFLKLTGF